MTRKSVVLLGVALLCSCAAFAVDADRASAGLAVRPHAVAATNQLAIEDGRTRDCPDATIEIQILTDGYGDETSWEVYDYGTASVIASGPATAYADDTLYIEEVCVDSTGCYKFTIYDAYGDGIFSPGYYEVYYQGTLVGSNTAFGSSAESVDLIGGGCVTSGACCVAGTCTNVADQAACEALGGLFFILQDCGTFTCPTCDGAVYFNGEYTKDNALRNTRNDDGSDVAWAVDDVKLLTAALILGGDFYSNEPTGFNWSGNCDLYIAEDSGGVPGTVLYELLDLPATRVDTGDTAFDDPIWHYTITGLNISLLPGTYWVSMRPVQATPYGTGDYDNGWIMTAAPQTGSQPYQATESSPTWTLVDEAGTAFCLTGTTGEIPTGACCNDSTASCQEGVLITECSGAGMRFIQDGNCADFDPTCGIVYGACCHPDGSCELTQEAECTDNWLGANTTCAQCPCVVICPPGATSELEACGDDTNGGCLSDPPVFQSIICGETICGTAWFDGTTRDTDSYELVLTEDTSITVTVEAEFGVIAGLLEQNVLGLPGCDNVTGYVAPYVEGAECEKASVTACVPAGTYYIFVAPTFDANVDCPADYTLNLTCEPCIVPRGACCLPSGACMDALTENECVVGAGGTYQGDDTNCSTTTCPQPGACCLLDGSCADSTPEDDCTAQGGTYQGDDTLCANVACPQPQPGDNCTMPLTFTLPADLPITEINYTCGRGNAYADTCLGYYDGGEDIIYELTVTEEISIELTLDPNGTTYAGMLLDDSCPGDATCIGYVTGSGSAAKTITCKTLQPGTYYVMIDTWPAPDCIPYFTLIIETCLPPDPYSETCEGAIVIPALPFSTEVDTDTAVADGPQGTCDKYYPTTTGLMQNDAWWVWTADADCFATATATGTYDIIMTVRDDCTALTELYCADATSTGAESIGFQAVSGTTYYFQVGDTGSSEGGGITTFTLTCSAGSGACCMPDGSCFEDTNANCAAAGGTYEGDGTTCDPNPCPQPVPGDSCALPIILTAPQAGDPAVTDSNYTCGRGNEASDTCLGSYDGGEDIFYEIDVAAPTNIKITVDPLGTTWVGFTLDDMCPPDASCIVTKTQSGSDVMATDCISLEAGKYYLMIDTWPSPACIPAFDLTIEYCEECDVICDPLATAEGEPTCYDDYEDTTNPGCNDELNPVFSPLACGDIVCATSGTYSYGGEAYRDTDWYEVVITEPMAMSLTMEAEFNVLFGLIEQTVLGVPGCDNVTGYVNPAAYAAPCEKVTGTTSCLPAGTYYLFVAPQSGETVPCGAEYQIELTCSPCDLDPYCAATGGCDEYIDQVTIGSIDNYSGVCSGYADYTDQVTDVLAGLPTPITVVVANAYPSDHVNVYGDWNQNFDLTDDTSVELTNDGTGVFTGLVPIPMSALAGQTRLRVRLEYNTVIGPCGTSSYGEVEDYTVNVVGICGDMDSDGDVDTDDYYSFQVCFGACDPDTAYNAAADYNNDGCIGLDDYQAWLSCYRAYNNRPFKLILQPGDAMSMPLDRPGSISRP